MTIRNNAPADRKAQQARWRSPGKRESVKKLVSETARNTDLSELVREVHAVDKRTSE